jgi:transposase InsO family protein
MTFLRNHVGQVVSIDFFTVPTIQLRVLYVLVVLAHDRRRILHFNVTEHPTAVWAAQQIVEAFPEDTAPRYMVRDRDAIYGEHFRLRVEGMGIEEIRIAPKSPWQNCFVERVIGSIRRECLDHVIVINDRHLRRLLTEYFRYYHNARTHLSLEKDSPESRAVQSNKAERIIQVPQVGGLHHRYERLAA